MIPRGRCKPPHAPRAVRFMAMHALETYPEIVKKIAIVDIGLLFGVVVRG